MQTKAVIFTPSMSANFWSHVQKSTPDKCWTWTGYINTRGYGTMGTRDGCFRAHRVSAVLHGMIIPQGMFVCHHCDNPRCVNPTHLYVGTAKDNAGDMVRRGRCASRALFTHCAKGHAFTPENTSISTRGGRIRRTCRRCTNDNRRLNYSLTRAASRANGAKGGRPRNPAGTGEER